MRPTVSLLDTISKTTDAGTRHLPRVPGPAGANQRRQPDGEHKFDLCSKLMDSRIAPSLRFIASGISLPAPIAVDLDISSACNFRCPECVDAISLNRGSISPHRLKSLIPQLAHSGVKAVNFVGGGEPTLHPRLPDSIQQADHYGLVTALVTNGSRLDKNLSVYAESVSSWLRVSVDAATATTHATVHGVDETYFPRILRSLAALARVKRAQLGYSFVVFSKGPQANYHEIADAARLAKNVGCDYFEAKVAVHPTSKHIVPVPPRVIEAIRQQVARAKELNDLGFRVVAPSSFRSLAEGKVQPQQKNYPTCLAQELRTTITPSGLYACTYHRGENEWSYGSLEQNSFQNLWNGSARQQLKARLTPARDCAHFCCRHAQNKYLHHLQKAPPRHPDVVKLGKPPCRDDIWFV